MGYISHSNLTLPSITALRRRRDQLYRREAEQGIDIEVQQWRTAIVNQSGYLDRDSLRLANNLMAQLQGQSYRSKIVFLLPLLGRNTLNATRSFCVPLIDTIGTHITSAVSLVDADFSESTGLQGDGSGKRIDLSIKPSQLGSGSNGGLGFWENNIDFTGSGTEVIGCYGDAGSSRFVLDLRSTRKFFSWGSPGNLAGPLTASTNGHYYGQRSSATSRELFFNGSSIGTDTTSDAAAGVSDSIIQIMGCNENGPQTFWKGRCAVAYLTDGTLTSGEVADFHTLLQTYLITPTGR